MGVILLETILKSKTSVKNARNVRAVKGLYFITYWNSLLIIVQKKSYDYGVFLDGHWNYFKYLYFMLILA